jgi:hypothetical protein
MSSSVAGTHPADLRHPATWQAWSATLADPLRAILKSAHVDYASDEDVIALVFPHTMLAEAETFLESLMGELVAFYSPNWVRFLEDKGFPNSTTAAKRPQAVEDFLTQIDCDIPQCLIVPRIRAEFLPPMSQAQ